MSNRRDFLLQLGRAAALAAVVDPAELIEMLAPRRLYVPGVDFGTRRFAMLVDRDGFVRQREVRSPFRVPVHDGEAVIGYIEVVGRGSPVAFIPAGL